MIIQWRSGADRPVPYRSTTVRFGILLFFLLLSPSGSWAQNLPDGENLTADETVDEQDVDLITQSLERDIATANRDELAAWCLVLGLDTRGDEEGLRTTLLSHYGLSVVTSRAEASGSGTRIVIESAGRSEYLSLDAGDEENESVVRLSGNVVISVSEPERGRIHRVEAETVIFNQEQKTISAVGSIRYTVDTDGREETFTGDSLTFEVSDWTGVIFRGTSERSQEVDGSQVEFFFRGESITRASKDILILENGLITSHDSENPDYSLKAKKIWITGPGEWGLLQATLYVGHVPVFYFPFYWKSGSDLFFNPVIGTRTRSGYYIQTTSYLLGRKTADDGFSIMGFGDSAGDSYNLERDGMFLVRVPSADGSSADRNQLKYMLDVYTSLGAMTGFLGSFPELGELGSLDFYATMGVSRSVSDTGSPYFNNGSSTSVYWNDSYIGGATVPFRWGTSLDMSLGQWNFYADWYSDPYYFQDFGSRSENFDWLSFLLSETETDTLNTDLVTEMKWEIRGSHSFPVGDAAPYLSSVSIDTFRTALTWRNKTNQDVTSSTSPDRNYDPARNFFYPDQLVLPDLKFSVRGSLPDWTVNRLDSPESDETGEPLIPDSDVLQEDGPDSAEYIDSFNAVYSTGLLDASLSYGLQSQLYIEDQSRSESWDAPSDIDFLFDPARINTTHRSDINYGIDFWDGLTGMTGKTNLSGFYQVHADMFGSGTTASSETRLEDYRYSQFLWDNSFSFFLNPLQGIPSFSLSRISYDFDGNIYAYQFDDSASVASPDYTGQWLDGKDDIRKHEAAARAVWNRWGIALSAGAISNIPPLDQRHVFSGAADYTNSGWAVGMSQQINYESNAWAIQPLIMTGSWAGWKDEVRITQNARFDSDNNRWSSAESSLLFWGFETRFTANYGTNYNWDGANYVWNTSGESFSPSTLRFSYSRDFKPLPMWKNRITLNTSLNSSWNINLRQPTDNIFTFSWTQELKIYKFLDLRFTISSTNKAMYLYFDGWRNQLGIPDNYNFFQDLAKSFNFFNSEDRRDSQFNMDRIDLSLVHHLRSWDLSIEYSGWPALDSTGTNYRWKSEFSLFVKWNPLPMFNQRTRFEDDSWTVDSFE